MHPDVEKAVILEQEGIQYIPSSPKHRSTSKPLVLLLAISFSLSFALLHLSNAFPSLEAVFSKSTSIVSQQEQSFAVTSPLNPRAPHRVVTPFNFSAPVKSYYKWLPEPERHRYPFFQSTSTQIKLNNSSPLISLRATSAVFVKIRTSENREDDGDPWEGETPREDEMIIVAKAAWPVIKDWEMKEWGVREVARILGGGAVWEGSETSRDAVGVWMNAPMMQGQPWAKPGHPPPDPNTTYILMSTYLTVVVAPNSKWRDLELTRIPNRDEDFQMWAWPSFDTGSASFEDVLLESEIGGVNSAYPNSSFVAKSLTISIASDNKERPSFGSVYGNFSVSSLNIIFGDVGSSNVQLNPHPTLSSSSSPNATISVGRHSNWTSDWAQLDLLLPKGSFEGEFDVRTAFGDLDVNVVPEEGQVMKIEKVGKWDGGSKKGVGFELLGSIRKKEGEREGEGRIELSTKQGAVNLKIA